MATLDTTRPLYELGFKGVYCRLLARVAGRALANLKDKVVVRKAFRVAQTVRPTSIWLDRTLVFSPEHLQRLRRLFPDIKILYFTPDDMLNPDNGTDRFMQCLPNFDFTVTTKSFHLDELKRFGALKVHFVDNAYDSRDHRPPSEEEARSVKTYDVVFVGGYERERAASLMRIARTGLSVKIVSWDFPRTLRIPPNVFVDRRFLAGTAYAQCIWSGRINLGFLRKVNRDLQTTRSVEIPACGGFMLAERTEEHKRLFAEDIEAVYFDSECELLCAIERYIKDTVRRENIAKAGRARVLKGRYDYKNRIVETLACLGLR